MSNEDESRPASRPAEMGLIRSEALLPGGKPLQILHRGEVYTLRRTRADKLILTK